MTWLAHEPGVLPLMLPIDAGAVGAVLLAFLNGKVAPSDPLVVVFRIGARHIELLLLSDCGDSAGAKGYEKAMMKVRLKRRK